MIQQSKCAGAPPTLPTDAAGAITRWQTGQTFSVALSLRVMLFAMRRPLAHVVRGRDCSTVRVETEGELAVDKLDDATGRNLYATSRTRGYDGRE